MKPSPSLGSKFLPALAAVSLVAGQAGASWQPLQRGPVAKSAKHTRPSLLAGMQSSSQDNTPLVAYRDLRLFFHRASCALETSAQLPKRMHRIAEQSTAAQLRSSQRVPLNTAYQSYSRIMDLVARRANFNGVPLLDGSLALRPQGTPPANLELPVTLPEHGLSAILSPDNLLAHSATTALAALTSVESAVDQVAQSRATSVQLGEQLDLPPLLAPGSAPASGTSSFPGIPVGPTDLWVPRNQVPMFLAHTAQSIERTGRAVRGMHDLARRGTAEGLSQSDRFDLQVLYSQDLNWFEHFPDIYSIADFVILDGNGKAILQDNIDAVQEITLDLLDHKTSAVSGLTFFDLSTRNSSRQAATDVHAQ